MSASKRFPGLGKLTLLLLAVGAFYWAAKEDGHLSDHQATQTGARAEVAYTVNGPAGEVVNITYTNSTGGTDRIQAALPWSYTFRLGDGGEYLSLAAHRNRTYTGSVQVAIAVNGQMVTQAYTNDPGGSAITSEYVRR